MLGLVFLVLALLLAIAAAANVPPHPPSTGAGPPSRATSPTCSDLQTSGVGIANIGGPCAR